MRALLAVLALALVLPSFPLPAQASETAEEQLLYEHRVPGSRAYALKVVTGATGAYRFEVASNYLGGPYPGHVDNFGAWLYNDAKAFQFGIAIGGGVSQDRTIATVGGTGVGADAVPPEGSVVVTPGDTSDPLDAGSVQFTIMTPPHSTRYVVAWAAGMHEARFRVWGPGDTQVQVNTGPAYALGDPDLDQGGLNVQAQKSYAQFQYVGAKALVKPAVQVQVQNGAYGLWASYAYKAVCPAGFGGPCTQLDAAQVCAQLRQRCDTTQLSWSGPGGSGGSGARAFNFVTHHPPGTYTFTVDAKADAYGPWRTFGVPWVGLGEDTSTLALADVALP